VLGNQGVDVVWTSLQLVGTESLLPELSSPNDPIDLDRSEVNLDEQLVPVLDYRTSQEMLLVTEGDSEYELVDDDEDDADLDEDLLDMLAFALSDSSNE
jgi:hypothetical protein